MERGGRRRVAMQIIPFSASFWASPINAQNPLSEHDVAADNAIVGGGYAGMSAAYYRRKARPDLKIALLEKEHIGLGPSGRNFRSMIGT